MKFKNPYLKVIALFISLITSTVVFGCTNITPSLTRTLNKNCGIPRTLTLTNTSTGSDTNTTLFIWRVNHQEVNRSTGKNTTTTLLTTPGTHNITLIAIDTSGCTDSATSTITITTGSTQVRDMTGFTHSPVWQNCILSANDPDTFRINVELNDTANNYNIIWGDGNNTSGTQLLPPGNVQHTYQNLGVYTFQLISNNGSCYDTLYGTVINERQPVAGLIGPPTGTNSGCVPLTVKFKNFSQNISPNTNFAWDMGDTILNFPSTTFRDSFFHTYYDFLCSQTVTLTASNACGESVTTWNPINASDRDSAIINAVNPTNCNLNVPFRFNNSSEDRFCVLPDQKTYYWDFGDGDSTGWITSNAQQQHTYTSSGTYTVTLIDSNSCGVDTETYILVIDTLPVAEMTLSDTLGCSPLRVDFVDLSTGTINTRGWNFGDPGSGTNNTSTDSMTSHTYNNGGNYNVVLTVSNVCGSVRDTGFIEVNQRVVAGFTAIPSACTPHDVTFTNTSVSDYSSVTYAWDFGDGTSSTAANPPNKTYTTPGMYTVTLIASDSCGNDTFSQNFNVYDLPVADFTVPTSLTCANASLFFDNTSTNSTHYTWDFGDGSAAFVTTQNNANKTYSTPGTYYITLISRSASSCRDTITDSISIHPNPVAIFTQDIDSGCGPLAVNFTNSSTHGGAFPIDSLTFQWDFSNGNTSTNINPSTSFISSVLNDTNYLTQLNVTNVFGCMDSTTHNTKLFPRPTVNYIVDTNAGCAPLIVEFTNTSTPNDTGNIDMMTFQWIFGNGNSSTNKDENQSFTDSRTMDSIHDSKLIGITEHGCMDSITQSQRVYPRPTINFTTDSSSGCSPLTVFFTNQSIPNDTGSIQVMNFIWDFGNGDSSILQDDNTVYIASPENDTNYYVNLVGITEHGCISNFVDTIVMFPKPRVDFIADNYDGCEELTVQFRDTSTHRMSSYWWFGNNGDTSTLFHPTHSFFGQPIYDSIIPVSHTVISSNHCLGDTITKNIVLYGDPISSFDVDEDTICYPDEKQMLNNSQGAISYLWNFGNGDTSTIFNPSHYFQESSNPVMDTTHNVQLVATNSHGCTDTSYLTITVLPYPIADFAIDRSEGCSPVDITFTNNSFNYDSVFWSFGDGAFSNIINPIHRYTNTGISDTAFRAMLTVKTLTCSDTASIIIPIHRPTIAFYNYERVAPCDAGFFDFIDQSVNSDVYLWDFGDGTTSNQINPRHQLNPSPYNDTAYLVKLITRTRNNCLDSMERMVPLPQRLRIGILDTTYIVCVPGEVNFENRTAGGVNFFWDFGDGNGAVQEHPTAIYRTPGNYTYKLTAYDPNGCFDTISSTSQVQALASPIARFTYDPPKNRMPNSTFNFTDQSIADAPLTYTWSFFDTVPFVGNSALQNPSYTFGDSGWYNVQLEIFNGSCYDTIVDSVRIDPPFPIPEFEANIDSGCAPLVVSFTNNSLHSSTYRWLFGDGASSTEFEPTHTYDYGGVYTVTLFSSGPGGEERIVKTDYINVLYQPFTRFSIAPNVGFLPDAQFYTRNETTGATSYLWSWVNPETSISGTSQEFEPTITINDTGYFDLELIATSDEGCSDTLFQTGAIFVNPNGTIYIPNTFTPNADDINDGFKPVYLNLDESDYYLEIFNRWGERVFETHDPTESWPGTYHGELCQQGVYAWRISTRFISGDPINKKGVVHLLR